MINHAQSRDRGPNLGTESQSLGNVHQNQETEALNPKKENRNLKKGLNLQRGLGQEKGLNQEIGQGHKRGHQ